MPESLPLDATALLILFARVGAVLMMLPVFSEESVPPRIRLLIALAVTTGMYGILSPRALPFAGDQAALPGVIIAELLVGLSLGAIVKIMWAAAAMAGSIVSLQVGLTSSIVYDASQGGHAPVLSRFVSVAAAVVCMALAVHHLWIGSIIQSYALFPVGGLPPAKDFAELAVSVTTRSMALALSLAAPLIVYGIVFNVALGLASRLAPAIQVFFIAQPLNLLLGIALFATVLGAMLTAFAAAMSAWLRSGWS